MQWKLIPFLRVPSCLENSSCFQSLPVLHDSTRTWPATAAHLLTPPHLSALFKQALCPANLTQRLCGSRPKAPHCDRSHADAAAGLPAAEHPERPHQHTRRPQRHGKLQPRPVRQGTGQPVPNASEPCRDGLGDGERPAARPMGQHRPRRRDRERIYHCGNLRARPSPRAPLDRPERAAPRGHGYNDVTSVLQVRQNLKRWGKLPAAL